MIIVFVILFLISINWTSLVIQLHLEPITRLGITIRRVEVKKLDTNTFLESLNSDKHYSRKYILLEGKRTITLIENFNIFALYSNDLEMLERLNKYPYVPFYYLVLEKKNRKTVLSFKLGQGVSFTLILVIGMVVYGLIMNGINIKIEVLLLLFVIILALMPFFSGQITHQNMRVDEALNRMMEKE